MLLNNIEIDEGFLGQHLLSKGFEVWFRYMFRVIEQKEFIMEEIHDSLFSVFDDIYNQKINRQNINVPPRAGKTTLAEYFLVYAITRNSKCNFIYTSFSQQLLVDISRAVMNIMEHPIYKAMYDNRTQIEDEEVNPIDDFWKDYLFSESGKNVYSTKKIITREGGVLLFASIGSTITGFGCFSYGTLVDTEKGFMQIGDIVTNKIKVKIKSYNFKTNKIELKEIENYIHNKNSKYKKITLTNGEIIESTPDHLFYDENGNTIFASELTENFRLFSNFFNFEKWYIKFFRYIFSFIILIKDKSNFFFSKLIIDIINSCFSASLKSDSFCFFSPVDTNFNIRNITSIKVVIFCYFLISSSIFCYLNGLFFSYLGISIMSSMQNTILFVFGLCAITKIINIIIQGITIKMSNNHSSRTNSQKSQSNKTVDPIFFIKFLSRKSNVFITLWINTWLKNSFAFCRKNFSIFRNKIISDERDFIVHNIIDYHNNSSYCLSIQDNNNMFITKSKVLVHNCGIRSAKGFSGALIIDDANKPADIYSQIMRNKVLRYFEETLLSRLNDSKAAIINIQQRLHLEDLSGFLKDKYNFSTLRKPLLNEQGICQIPKQYTPERISELQSNAYMFSAQYQQEPIPQGGMMIKSEWFRYYTETPEFKRVFMTGDTAQKTKEHNDFSVFCVWGQFNQELYLLDMIRGKWEAPELLIQAESVIKKYQKYTRRLSEIILEDKSSGTGLIQTLRRTCQTPIHALQVDKDKVTRVDDSTPFLSNGYFYLPQSKEYGFNTALINECELFARDNSHSHDDIVDNITMAIQHISKKRSYFDGNS